MDDFSRWLENLQNLSLEKEHKEVLLKEFRGLFNEFWECEKEMLLSFLLYLNDPSLRDCFGIIKLAKNRESAYLVIDQNNKDNADKFF